MTKSNERFIRVYNVFFDNREDRDEFKLTADELFAYIVIEYSQESYRKTRVFYEGLLYDMNKKNTKANREELIQTINSLAKKKVITIHNEEKSFMTLSVNHTMFKDLETESKHSFEKLYINELEALLQKSEGKLNEVYFYLLVKHETRHGAAHFESKRRAILAYSLIAEKLNISKATATRLVAAMIDKGIITNKVVRKSRDSYESTEYFCALIEDKANTKNDEVKKSENKKEEKVKKETKEVKREGKITDSRAEVESAFGDIKTEKVVANVDIGEAEVREFPTQKTKKEKRVKPINKEAKVIEYDNTKKVEAKGEVIKSESDKLEDKYNKQKLKEKELKMQKAAEIREQERAKEEVYQRLGI